jgi:hypothetical protein
VVARASFVLASLLILPAASSVQENDEQPPFGGCTNRLLAVPWWRVPREIEAERGPAFFSRRIVRF